MAENSKIEWCDHTFNGWEGCTKVSPGCANCYAEARNHRYGLDNWGKGKSRRRTSEGNWLKPVRWNNSGLWCDGCGGQKGIVGHEHKFRRPRVFCASLADWLDDEVPIEWLADLLKLIHDTPNLDWLLLTKRPENFTRRVLMAGMSMMGYAARQRSIKPEGLADAKESTIESVLGWSKGESFPDNVWVGTTVENQEQADRRIPELLKIPAKVRFLSCEPLLGAVDLHSVRHGSDPDLSAFDFGEIDWVICGGESGPKARAMHPDWARSLRDQCQGAGVPFFFKQWGEWGWFQGGHPDRRVKCTFIDNGGEDCFKAWMGKVGKKAAGRLLDGREWSEFPGVEVER